MVDAVPSRLATISLSIIDRYVLLFLFIVGILGNSLNIYVFSRAHLRQNLCVFCLLISSCLNIITDIFGILIRCLISYNIDLTYYSPIFCKLRYYFVYVSKSGSLWFVVFACIDRYLSSSLNIRHRQWMNRKKTNRIIFCILFLSLFSFTEVFYCFEASSITNGFCTIRDRMCLLIDTAIFLVFNSFLPPSLMLGFGISMLMNIKHSRQRIGEIPTYTTPMNKINRRDRQLISMLLVQVVVIVLSMFPIDFIKLYLSITSSMTKSTAQINKESFAYQVSITVSYVNSSAIFFIYTLRGKLFRDELIRLFDRYYDRLYQRLADTCVSSSMNSTPILISHRDAPIQFLLGDDDEMNNVPVIHCQISSNLFFYTTFLNELLSSSHFAKVFHQLLIQMNRTRLKYLFTSIRHRPTQIYLRVHQRMDRYDEWINRLWTSIQLHVLINRIRYESSWAWLSTLGGGHSCLGEESSRHAKKAEAISKNQIGLSTEIGDPNALVKSYLFLSLSYLQQKRYEEVRIILRFQYRRIQGKDITEERLPIMCIALWKKMKYAIKRDKKLN